MLIIYFCRVWPQTMETASNAGLDAAACDGGEALMFSAQWINNCPTIDATPSGILMVT
jgi:hypothetical protein